MFRVGVLVNEIDELEANQTTVQLVRGCAERGWATWVIGVQEIGWSEPRGPYAWAHPVSMSTSAEALLEKLGTGKIALLGLKDLDLLLIRTNPARDQEHWIEHELALSLARMAQRAGVLVLNDPRGLAKAGDKSYLYQFSSRVRPQSKISCRTEDIYEFVRNLGGPSVLKPLRGTHGTSVLLVDDDSEFRNPLATHSLDEALSQLGGTGPILAQEYLPEAIQGDTRVLLLEGVPLELDGEVAAVRRIPPESDFRSNVHLGGKPEPISNPDLLRDLVKEVTNPLVSDGLFFVGLDVIGNKIIEINVFSPGGLLDAEVFYERDFLGVILDRIERRLDQHRS